MKPEAYLRNGDGASNPAPRFALDRLPPYNVVAEKALLGSLLLDNDTLHEAEQVLRGPEDFFRDSHQVLYRAIRDLLARGVPADGVTLHEELTLLGQLDAAGGAEAISECLDAAPHACNAAHYAGIVRELAITRDAIATFEDGLRAAYSRQSRAAEVVTKAQEGLYRLACEAIGGGAVSGAVCAAEARLRLVRRFDGQPAGVMTGLADLDAIAGGLQDGCLHVLAARPSIGKSSLALNVCEYLSIDKGTPTLFVSLEMKRLDLMDRLFSSIARIDGNLIRRPKDMTSYDLNAFRQAEATIARGKLLIDDTPGRTAAQIGSLARHHIVTSGVKLLVIDYLLRVDMQPRKGESRENYVARTCTEFANLARDLKIPILLLHQLNRQCEAREDRRPRMSDLRDSGQVEADADQVWLLHRPEQYRKDDRPGECDLIVAKNRCGATGAVRLAFDKRITKFSDLARPGQVETWDYDD